MITGELIVTEITEVIGGHKRYTLVPMQCGNGFRLNMDQNRVTPFTIDVGPSAPANELAELKPGSTVYVSLSFDAPNTESSTNPESESHVD